MKWFKILTMCFLQKSIVKWIFKNFTTNGPKLMFLDKIRWSKRLLKDCLCSESFWIMLLSCSILISIINSFFKIGKSKTTDIFVKIICIFIDPPSRYWIMQMNINYLHIVLREIFYCTKWNLFLPVWISSLDNRKKQNNIEAWCLCTRLLIRDDGRPGNLCGRA